MGGIKEQDLKSWEEFEKEIDSLTTDLEKKRETSPGLIPDYLYRGHTDSTWELKTTLDRYINNEIRLTDYYKIILIAKPQIETFTGKVWGIPTYEEYHEYISKLELRVSFSKYGYGYLIYMRHHGFPSPLLDWTRSPYMAAFFAFRNETKAEQVSIYVYQESPSYFTSYSSDLPNIVAPGPYITSHERHFLQQSDYTICTIIKDKDYFYSPHQEFVRDNEKDQDKVLKFNIPSTERVKVLKKLDSYNLNAFSLFSNEEALMETLALREIIFRNKF